MTKVPLLRNNENFPTSSNNSRNTIVINSIFSLVYMHALFTGSRWGFSLLLAERFLAARSKEKRLYSQAIEKLETVANGTEISPKSFLKFWKLLISEMRTFQPKILAIPGAKWNGKKTSGKILSKRFGYTFRGWPLFWKFWKMLFHSLLEVVANSKPTFWLIFWRSFTHNNTHYVFHNWAVTVTGWLWSVKHLQVNLMSILFWLSLYVPTLPWLTTCFKYDQNHHFT